MEDTDINKLNGTNGTDGTNDVAHSGNVGVAGVPTQTPPEAFPSREKPKYVEGEKSSETFPSPRPPTPKSREGSSVERFSEEREKMGSASKSGGRLVDERGNSSVSKIETSDALTEYGDQEEDKFIKGVKSAHGSSES